MRIHPLSLLPLALTLAASGFEIEKMPNPPGVDPQIGGLDALPDGRLVAAFHRGEVMFFNPADRSWQLFAAGLHEPLGIVAESPYSFLVMQRAELTRLVDTDRDGTADAYQTVYDDFGLTGNYHEFAFGPARGPDGSIYVGLNVASNGAGTRAEIRGEWSEIGDLDQRQMVHDNRWGQRAGKAGRMYSRVPWRGWVMKISPDGKKVEPFASGFRSPDGIGFDAQGNLLVTDNQGDWRGTSPLYTVVKGGFYGHPASLVWNQGWNQGDPLKLQVSELQKLRVAETARFPQGDLANSPTQPIAFPKTWNDYAGQTLIGEMNQNRMVRFLGDRVGGFLQGALIPMFDGAGLGNGNHRLAFTPDGSLWVGKTHLSWAGAEGLVRIKPPAAGSTFIVQDIRLEKRGGGHVWKIRFNQPVAPPQQPLNVTHYDYRYHRDYGSPKVNSATQSVHATVPGGKADELEIPARVTEGFVHQIDLTSLRSASGKALEGSKVYYQASRLP